MANPILRTKLAEGKFFVVPGVQDMIAAVIADRVGFDILYGTGYWLTASAYGLPDTGIASYTQMVDRMATVARTRVCGDSHEVRIVIQALDGSRCFDRRSVGEDGATLFGEADRPWA